MTQLPHFDSVQILIKFLDPTLIGVDGSLSTIHSLIKFCCVLGEFMQLGSKENENARFAHYLRKTYKKTASLMANSCKAVS
mgnify:CR=1 FL=1